MASWRLQSVLDIVDEVCLGQPHKTDCHAFIAVQTAKAKGELQKLTDDLTHDLDIMSEAIGKANAELMKPFRHETEPPPTVTLDDLLNGRHSFCTWGRVASVNSAEFILERKVPAAEGPEDPESALLRENLPLTVVIAPSADVAEGDHVKVSGILDGSTKPWTLNAREIKNYTTNKTTQCHTNESASEAGQRADGETTLLEEER